MTEKQLPLEAALPNQADRITIFGQAEPAHLGHWYSPKFVDAYVAEARRESQADLLAAQAALNRQMDEWIAADPKPLVALTDEQILHVLNSRGPDISSVTRGCREMVSALNAEFCRINGLPEPKP